MGEQNARHFSTRTRQTRLHLRNRCVVLDLRIAVEKLLPFVLDEESSTGEH